MNGLPQRVRAFDRRHPLWWDLGLAVVIAAISINATPRARDFSSPADMVGLALLLIIGTAVVFRRRSSLTALLVALTAVVAGAASSSLTGLDIPWTYLAMWVLLFNTGLRRGRSSIAGIAAVIALTGLSALIAPVDGIAADLPERIRSLLTVTAMAAASYLGGAQIASRQESLDAQRRETARAAVIAERSRIAQEMHDLIGHNLSVIASLANGGAVAARTSPQESIQAFEAIGQVSRSSVQEVRRILSVLRHDSSDDGAPLSPQPGVAEIPAIIESMRAAGLRVQLQRTGDLRDLAPGLQLALYRIVQESLTNVLRHARADTRADVAIRRAPDEVIVTVENTGPQVMIHRESADDSAHGLIGMRERAEAYGGTFHAGPRGAGWVVRAAIPTHGGEK